jgi:murein DD-endopeptidase MepM/ murein hydrolase activator NlpD
LALLPRRFRNTGRHHLPPRRGRRALTVAATLTVASALGAGAAYAATDHPAGPPTAAQTSAAPVTVDRQRAAQQRASRDRARTASPSASASRSASPSPSPSRSASPTPKATPVAWVLPVHGYTVTSQFGARWGTNHPGVDLAVGTGTPVYAAHAGTVTLAGWDGGYGNGVEIDDGAGLSTVYGHNSSVVVSAGQHVARGQLIAYSGSTGDSTGPHLHFELRRNGVAFDPVPYLRARGLNLLAGG